MDGGHCFLVDKCLLFHMNVFSPLFTHNTKINLRMPMHAFVYTVLLTLSIWSSFENS